MSQRLNTEDIKLGDYVKSRTHGHRGRVVDIDWVCSESKAWLAAQPQAIRDQIEGKPYVTWVSYLTEGGGSVLVPASDLDIVEPFVVNNDYEDEYFRTVLVPARV